MLIDLFNTLLQLNKSNLDFRDNKCRPFNAQWKKDTTKSVVFIRPPVFLDQSFSIKIWPK